jgi:2-aminoadipate transaminase
MVIEQLERVLDELQGEGVAPRFIYVITDFQNPTGVVLSEERRHRLIDVATERNLLLIEDDVYGDLTFDGAQLPSLYSMRRIDNVIRLGTFSKIVGAGLRLGWLVAAPDILAHLLTTKIDGGTSSFASLVVTEYLQDRLETRVAEMRDVYRAKRDVMLDALDVHFADFAEWSRPQGGLFLWLRLPEGFDSVARLPDARRADVDYLPGPNFSPTRSGANYLRLSFGYLNADDIREGLARLADVVA